jgi:hypothetical protein
MVSLPTVSSFFCTRGCFLRGGWSPSGDPTPLSLACGWPPGANGSPPVEWRHLQGFRVEDPSGARKGGPNRPREWAGPAGLGRPAWAHLGPVRSPLRSRVSSWNYALCPLHLHDFDDVILSSKRRFSAHEVRSFPLQSPGVFLIALRSLPPLVVISSSSRTRTRLRKCSFELVANPSFMSMFSYINAIRPNACT